MNNPATTEVWQTTFGKDFGGIAQGCNKTGQKSTNAMFIMTRAEIASALVAGKNLGTSAHIPSVSLFCNPRTVARFHTIPEQGKNRTPKQSIPEQHGLDPKTVYSRAACVEGKQTL